MAETSRVAQVAREMKTYGIKIPGISESRWKGMGSMSLQSGGWIVCVRDDNYLQEGVTIMMSQKA